MANAHPQEQALYAQIQQEKIKVPLPIWDLMYRYIGDDVTAIAQIASYYWRDNKPIELDAARKILVHTKKIDQTVKKILHPEKFGATGEGFATLKEEDKALHPVINELFTHYIGNDIYGINMIVGFYLDPLDEGPIPVEDAKKILDKTQTIRQFMEKLSVMTNQAIEQAVREEIKDN